jgi:hypothetical protein
MWEYGVFSQMAQGILKFLLMNMLRRFNPHQIGVEWNIFQERETLRFAKLGMSKRFEVGPFGADSRT